MRVVYLKNGDEPFGFMGKDAWKYVFAPTMQ